MFQPWKVGLETMENITTEQQYGKFFSDNEELTSVLEIGSNGLKRAYKSRSGESAKNRAKRIFVGNSKRKYYITSELTSQELKRLKDFNIAMAYYNQAKGQGIKDIKRPIEPRFTRVEPRFLKKKDPYKTKEQWQRLVKKYEDFAINNFNCSGNFKKGEWYITLTQRDGRVKSQDMANKQYQAFTKALQRWINSKKAKDGSKFKYTMLTIKEYGSKGYHYHVLLKLFVSRVELVQFLENHWKEKNGNYKLESLTDALKLGKYFFGNNANDRVSSLDMLALDEKIDEMEQQQQDFIRLKKTAKKKGLDEVAKGYDKDIAITKNELKRLRRSRVKSDDKIMRTSGAIKRTIKVVTSDKRFWQFIRETSEYLYSERIIISDTSETSGETYILNEIFSDYYRQSRKDGKQLYNYARWLIRHNRAIEK